MAQLGITEYVRKTISNKSAYELFSAQELIENAAKEFGVSKDNIMYSINVVLNRQIGKDILRYQKGIYYRPDKNIFGIVPLSAAEEIYKEYVEAGEERIGYLTGPSLFLKLGLTTQVPKSRYYASNKVQKREKKISFADIVIRPTKTTINKDNYLYFQILDVFENKDSISFDTEEMQSIMLKLIKDQNIDFIRLVGTAKKYYSMKTLEGVLEMAQRRAV